PALVAAGPERELLGSGEVITAGTRAPVVRGVLPVDAAPAGALRGLVVEHDLDGSGAAVGVFHEFVVVLDVPIVAHPARRDIVIVGSLRVGVDLELLERSAR